MHNLIFRGLANLRQNYWFWPSLMTFFAVVLGLGLPYLDTRLGDEWMDILGFLRPTGVDGARDILTTMAGATLGVAGVAFSVTIVAVSFASGNYGPRLISNFMSDRQNQIVLGIFVATFVYCITVLSTVHTDTESSGAFVPQISLFLAMLLTLGSVGALIAYIHHIPESINIMNLTARIGDKLQQAIRQRTEQPDHPDRRSAANTTEANDPGQEIPDLDSWCSRPPAHGAIVVTADCAGFLQQFDIDSLQALAQEHATQIILHRAPGDFLVAGDAIISATQTREDGEDFQAKLCDCYTQGTNRTDVQDIMFLADQLVEVLARALSPGINDPQTAILCLNWLKCGLSDFARAAPARAARTTDPVLFRRVTCAQMLEQSFNQMRQYIAQDRTVTLHAITVLADIAAATEQISISEACSVQINRLKDTSRHSIANEFTKSEIDAASRAALGKMRRKA